MLLWGIKPDKTIDYTVIEDEGVFTRNYQKVKTTSVRERQIAGTEHYLKNIAEYLHKVKDLQDTHHS